MAARALPSCAGPSSKAEVGSDVAGGVVVSPEEDVRAFSNDHVGAEAVGSSDSDMTQAVPDAKKEMKGRCE